MTNQHGFDYIQYDGENAFEIACKINACGYSVDDSRTLIINTENGAHLVKKGTVILQYSNVNLLFLKEETFREKYPDLKLQQGDAMGIPKFTEADAELVIKMGGCINKERTSAEVSFLCIQISVERLQDGGYRCQLHDDEWVISEDERADTLPLAIDKSFTAYIQQYNIVGDAVRAISSMREKMESDEDE